jgi:hypothetical protein
MMSRREKLLRWAQVLRNTPELPVAVMYKGLERMDPKEWDALSIRVGALTLALEDPILKAEGLGGETFADAMRFFELTQDDMWAFYEEHGFYLKHDQMAYRLERTAEGEKFSF